MATQTASIAEAGQERDERRARRRLGRVTLAARSDRHTASPPSPRAAIVAAAVAVWVTLRADFLAHPGWLALQKADIILGPVLVGLYWRHRRPGSAFGTLLIVAGFLSVPYILQSSSAPVAYAVGVAWESRDLPRRARR